MNPLLTKAYDAGAAISRYRIVKFGADDDHVIQSAASTDAMFGIVDIPGAAVAEDRVDVVVAGIAEVEFGGAVTRGGLITSDASGKAVAAAPGAGTNVDVIGRALVSAVDGDIGPALVVPSQVQG